MNAVKARIKVGNTDGAVFLLFSYFFICFFKLKSQKKKQAKVSAVQSHNH